MNLRHASGLGEPYERPLPWQAGHLLAGLAVVGFGAVCVLVSWWGASGSARSSDEVAWMNLGVGGLIVIGGASAMWTMVGRRAVGHRQAALTDTLEGILVMRGQPGSVGRVKATKASVQTGALVWGRGMTHFHSEGCQLVLGKQVRAATLRQHERAGRLPCAMCEPHNRPPS